MATEVAASQAGRGRGEQEQALAGNLPFVVAVGAMRRMSNNINKPPYLAAARRQCKTTRRMRNFLVVIILRPSERASQLFSLINWLKASQAKTVRWNG